MKKLFTLFALAACSITFGQRYLTEVFSNVDSTVNITYGQGLAVSGFNVPVLLDIYEPQGDNLSERPLMILAHGGSFVSGSRKSQYIVEICKLFARKGYVTASISYRLGINFSNIAEIDKEFTRAAFRAIQDYSASTRFFFEDARDNGNTYRIDTNRIIAGGVSAGSIAAVHSQLFNDPNTASPAVQQIVSQLGGISGGNTGSLGYPNRTIGLFEIIGAILDTQMVNNPNIATISFHGTADNVVPYGIGFATFNGAPILELHGSSVLIQRLQNMGATANMNTFPGVGHDIFSNPADTDTIMNRATRFFYREVITNPSVGLENESRQNLEMYPNPSAGNFVIVEVESPSEYALFNILGKTIKHGMLHPGKNEIDLAGIPKGIYLLRTPLKTQRLIRQ
jgi:acetyl esterase/lipase